MLAAVVAALLGALFTPLPGVVSKASQALYHSIHPRPKARRTPSNIAFVRELHREVATSLIWDGRPQLFARSFQFFQDHFSAVEPTQLHQLSGTADADVVDVLEVVRNPAPNSGRIIHMIGRYADMNDYGFDFSPADRPDLAGAGRTFDLQLAPLRGPLGPHTPVVYCRVPATKYDILWHFGDYVRVDGIVLAGGNIKSAEGGFAQGAFMACSVAARVDPPLSAIRLRSRGRDADTFSRTFHNCFITATPPPVTTVFSPTLRRAERPFIRPPLSQVLANRTWQHTVAGLGVGWREYAGVDWRAEVMLLPGDRWWDYVPAPAIAELTLDHALFVGHGRGFLIEQGQTPPALDRCIELASQAVSPG